MVDPVSRALTALREGRPVLVADDQDRENEGDVVLAAATSTPEWIAWTIRHTSGLLCAPITGELARRLALPQMVADNKDPRSTAYTVSVDARVGVTTGISAADRCRTLLTLADPRAEACHLARPGHVFPLRARSGGVLERRGHTEAAVDLCRLAGVASVGALAELVTDAGTTMRYPEMADLGSRWHLPVLTIAELVNFRRQHPDLLPMLPSPRVRRGFETVIGTEYGRFRAVGYQDLHSSAEHVALINWPTETAVPGRVPVVRVHSECLTGEAFHSQRCECGPQLDAALRRVAVDGGVVVYLRGHEGRGIGLMKKLAAYRLQDRGLDTVQANLELNEPADAREYGSAAAILDDLGITSVRLLTNNPAKVEGLLAGGIDVECRIPLIVGAGGENIRYLRTKRERMGHHLPLRELS